jgi:branched-chain amino acid transport system ATP-binding protein
VLLELKQVAKTFGGIKAVDGFDMAVEDHEIVGLIGPNGAGKTTVFNLITSVYKPYSGSIYFAGEPIHRLPPHEVVGKGIARTFQNIRLFNNLSVLENVKLALHNVPSYGFLSAMLGLPSMRRQNQSVVKKAMEFLDLMGLSDRAEMRAGGLPYGLSRRLEIARALALSPKLLLLDEPAAGMNPDEIVGLRELIAGVHRDFNLTIILIEHRMDLVMAICPRLVVLNFGTKLTEGTQQEVQTNPAVLQAYLGGDYANVAG